MTTYDVIVIGGGHNGLVCAAKLAEAGRRVVVLERRSAVGGLAAGDEFHPGFTAGGLLHDTSTFRGHLADALELDLVLGDAPPVFVPQAPGAGPGLLLHRRADRARTEIEAHSAPDAERYAAFRAFIDRLKPVRLGMLDAEPPALPDGPGSLLLLIGRGIAMRRLKRADMMELMRVAPMCAADWLNEWFRTQRLSCALAAPALAGMWGGPWSPGTAANVVRHELTAQRAVRGGATTLVRALKAGAEAFGAEIRTGAEVSKIRMSGGAVAGVTLVNGETIDAPVIASGCDPKRTLLDLLPGGAIAPTLAHAIGKVRTRGTTAKVDLALRGEGLRFACRAEHAVEHACIAGETLDDLERAFDAVKYRRHSETPMLDVHAAPPESGLAPDGSTTVSIVAHFAPYDLEGGWTDDARARFGDVVVQTLARYAPDVPERIVARRVLTPVDIEAQYGTTGGHIHHGEHALDQMVVRPVPECARYATPVRGLFLCGSGSHPGGGITGACGELAAAMIAR